MLLKSVLIGFLSFSILHAETLKECKNETDKISGCVEKGYYEDGWIETPYKNGKKQGIEKIYYESGDLIAASTYKNEKIISGKCGDGKAFSNAHLHNLEKKRL